jgi:hypothetical protein
MKINTEVVLDASKEVALEGNVQKTKEAYMLMSRRQITGQNR